MASGIEAEEVSVEIFLCREREECLRKVLKSPSLVVIGGRWRRWPGKERKLQSYLRTLGHKVIFVEMEAKHHAGSLLHFHMRPFLRRLLGFHQGL